MLYQTVRSTQITIPIVPECKPFSVAGLSNLNQPRAANCQLSLLTGHNSVVSHRSLPLPQWRERKENHKLVNIKSKYYDLEFFKHFISYIQQFNIDPILLWFFSGPHRIASRAACGPWAAGWKALLYRVSVLYFTWKALMNTLIIKTDSLIEYYRN